MRNNQIVNICQCSTGKVATFKCITYNEYRQNVDYYNKFRDPSDLKQIMNGVYIILDSEDVTHCDRHIVSELKKHKQYYTNYRRVTPVKIHNGDIVYYKNTNSGNTKKLMFCKMSAFESEQYKGKQNGIEAMINDTVNEQLPMDTLYSHIDYCYPGKKIIYEGELYYIQKVERKVANVILSNINSIKSTISVQLLKVKKLVKTLI